MHVWWSPPKSASNRRGIFLFVASLIPHPAAATASEKAGCADCTVASGSRPAPEHLSGSDRPGHAEPRAVGSCREYPHAQRSGHLHRAPPAQSEASATRSMIGRDTRAPRRATRRRRRSVITLLVADASTALASGELVDGDGRCTREMCGATRWCWSLQRRHTLWNATRRPASACSSRSGSSSPEGAAWPSGSASRPATTCRRGSPTIHTALPSAPHSIVHQIVHRMVHYILQVAALPEFWYATGCCGACASATV